MSSLGVEDCLCLKETLQRLPGCTRHNGKYGPRDPEVLGDELMSIE